MAKVVTLGEIMLRLSSPGQKRFVQSDTFDVVYGGGLKTENAKLVASVPDLDGGLIALTRFQGEIGFYPEEYLQIVKEYMGR